MDVFFSRQDGHVFLSHDSEHGIFLDACIFFLRQPDDSHDSLLFIFFLMGIGLVYISWPNVAEIFRVNLHTCHA